MKLKNYKISRFFSIITGRVPVILVQRITNLVKKFALLLHKYRFNQDCRNRLCVMSGNDGYCGFGHSVCYQFFKRIYHPGSSANELTLKAKDDNRSVLQLGRSMIEMLGVLAIIAVLSVGGIAGYSKAMIKFKTNKVVDNVSTIVTNIKTLYAEQKNYNGLDTATAISMGAVPDELGTSTASNFTLTNSFGGSVFIITNSYNTFEIYFDSLPKEACIALATNDWGNSSGLIAIQATSTGGWNLFEFSKGCEGYASNSLAIACPMGTKVSTPMSPEIAAKACDCTGDTCTVGWRYE